MTRLYVLKNLGKGRYRKINCPDEQEGVEFTGYCEQTCETWVSKDVASLLRAMMEALRFTANATIQIRRIDNDVVLGNSDISTTIRETV